LYAQIGQLTMERDFFGQRVSTRPAKEGKTMIVRDNPNLSITRQCRILPISRSLFYCAAKGENEANLTLMRLMGLEAVYQAPRTYDPHPGHRVYPYLLRGMAIKRPNQVWCTDITYVPVQYGFLYLVAIMDWATRHRRTNSLGPVPRSHRRLDGQVHRPPELSSILPC